MNKIGYRGIFAEKEVDHRGRNAGHTGDIVVGQFLDITVVDDIASKLACGKKNLDRGDVTVRLTGYPCRFNRPSALYSGSQGLVRLSRRSHANDVQGVNYESVEARRI